MFSTFLGFELRFWLRAMMVYVFLVIMTCMIMSLALSDDPSIDLIFKNALHNSPFVVQQMYAASAVLGCLMVVAFVNAAASRDFVYNTHQLVFTKPISKLGMLLGRFAGAMIVSLIPMLGASFGILISQLISQYFMGNQTMWGPNYWAAHFWGLFVFAVPNIFFISSIVFAIAIFTRSTLASFVGIIGLMVALSVASAAVGGLGNETLTAMVDPFGADAFNLETKYWTLDEKNTQYVTLSGMLLWNRLLWVGVGCAFFALGYFKFSFTNVQKSTFVTRAIGALKDSFEASFFSATPPQQIPTVQQQFGLVSNLKRMLSQIKVDFWTTIKTPTFITVICGLVIALMIILVMGAAQGFGLKTLPVTISMAEGGRAALVNFTIGLVTFYTGVMVWKERDANLNDIYDACPHPTWITFVAKMISMLMIMFIVLVVTIICGVIVQLANGHLSIQFSLYFSELLVLEFLRIYFMIVMAMLIQVLSPNKYVGFFAFIIFLVANQFVWTLLGVESIMFRYGELSSYTYSDMFKYGPFATAIFWFGLYWFLFSGILAIAATLLWQRGREKQYSTRFQEFRERWIGKTRLASIGLLFAWICCAGWIYWNTIHLNSFKNREQRLAEQYEYESKYKPYATAPQPRITKIRYDIDLYPESRRLVMKGKQTLVNKTDKSIDKIYLVSFDNLETEIEIEGAALETLDDKLKHWTFNVEPPIQPGSSREMNFKIEYNPKGFENSVSFQQIVQNGTFFNNAIAPQIGYQPAFELTSKKQRKRFGLKEATNIASLDRDNLRARSNTYLSNNSDWVDVETVISTSNDQIAIAPGSLVRKWQEDGRRYFHYKLDHPSLNFYSFVSARYKVAQREWKGVDIEVYYHPEHEWNVDLMLKSIRSSLEYYTEAFGPYKHKQARIIEFPRTSSFAQAFPGTMPYSEGVGFIADISESNDIDMVFYVTAHEMAHQWWAHQVIGANMQGATLLSETLAQYSSLMVMEKEYGRDMMRKFLRYEMDNYLRGRGHEQEKEYPLVEVKPQQGYIHYNKGSIAMYHLKEMIGEERVNAALRALVDKFGYADRPYPTSLDLVDALKEQTPAEYQDLLIDLFDEITLFANRTTKASYKELKKGKYEVTLEIECKKFQADSKGKESEVEVDDWIEIGAFEKPAAGKKYGKTLYRERFKINKSDNSFTFTVDKLPHRVGVDPFSLLIDRDPADNVREPLLIKSDDD